MSGVMNRRVVELDLDALEALAEACRDVADTVERHVTPDSGNLTVMFPLGDHRVMPVTLTSGPAGWRVTLNEAEERP